MKVPYTVFVMIIGMALQGIALHYPQVKMIVLFAS